MNNILTAIQAIVENPSIQVALSSKKKSKNRANQMGDAFENYVMNAFANCFGMEKRDEIKVHEKVFSYIGTSRDPIDAILNGGDAIEIKKITDLDTVQLQLNSSYPKNKLHANNSKLNNDCRTCENWRIKDMIYVVGQVNGEDLQNIFFVYGDLYCDSREIYENVENSITEGLHEFGGLDLSETKELARVNHVDHLKISDLRVRGMWLIESPFVHFDYLTDEITDYTFKLVALIPEDKYLSFENVRDFEEFCSENGVTISDEEIEDPQNPAQLIDAKLITYYY